MYSLILNFQNDENQSQLFFESDCEHILSEESLI